MKKNNRKGISLKLCFSTYVSVLLRGKARTTNQGDIVRALFNTLPNHYDAFDDTEISFIVNGMRNVPDVDIPLAKDCDPHIVSDNFDKDILTLLDNNKKSLIVLALKDIIAKDKDIRDDTVIELVNGITKAAFLERDSYVYADLLAGLFLYILIYTDNRGSKDMAKAITEEYLNGFRDKEETISYLTSYSNIGELVSVSLSTDAHTAALLAEAEGKCLNCGRPIGVNDGTEVNRAKVLSLPDNTDVIVCADCERIISSADDTLKQAIAEKKRKAAVVNSVRDDIACEKLDGEIELVLRGIQDLGNTADTTLKYDPVMVDRKIADSLLRNKVRNEVITLFDIVNSVLDRLAGEHAFDSTRFARQIKRAFEDTKDTPLSQRQIYDLLVEKLNTKSGGQYKTACEAIISYFVQRCEVFDEIAE